MQPEEMTVVLTGACGGIGKLLARLLAARGASLFLCGGDEAALAALQQELQAKAGDGQLIDARALDLTDDAQVDEWLTSIEQTGRPLNVLVNNAGICKFEMFEKLSDRRHRADDEFEQHRTDETDASAVAANEMPARCTRGQYRLYFRRNRISRV